MLGHLSLKCADSAIALSATGSGKTRYIYMLMLTILTIIEQPSLCPSAEFPKKPAILVIYPGVPKEVCKVTKGPVGCWHAIRNRHFCFFPYWELATRRVYWITCLQNVLHCYCGSIQYRVSTVKSEDASIHWGAFYSI